jgi:hypothetical protein
MNGNQSFFGVAARHPGTNPDYPPAQIDGIVAVCAALCTARNLRPTTAFHHREWSLRKIDMSWQGDIRARVTAAMGAGGGSTNPPVPVPPNEEIDVPLTDAEIDRIARATANFVWDRIIQYTETNDVTGAQTTIRDQNAAQIVGRTATWSSRASHRSR